jgi:putative pyruvate formate lyase activating enzyme
MLRTDELKERVRLLLERLAACDLCPHACGVNRLAGEVGRCRAGARARIASACDHHGEEPAISGRGGSGTVFAAGCNLRCVFCQNAQISQGDLAQYPEQTAAEIADTFLRLQRLGCHNLNWVSPTHVAPQLVEALAVAVELGLRLPVVYNSNGYDSVTVLRSLDGIVDIYLPDLKYADAAVAERLSGAPGYPDAAIAAIREMYRQAGNLELDENDVARRGVIVRHLVLPGGLAGSRAILRRLAEEVSPTVTVSLMAQYYPAHRAGAVPELSRTITVEEYEDALDAFAAAGLENGWAQEVRAAPEYYRPDFRAEHPFEQ